MYIKVYPQYNRSSYPNDSYEHNINITVTKN